MKPLLLLIVALTIPLDVANAQWRPFQRLFNANNNCSNAAQSAQSTCSLADASCSAQSATVNRFEVSRLVRQPIFSRRNVVVQQAAGCTNVQCDISQCAIPAVSESTIQTVSSYAIPDEVGGASAHAQATLDAVRTAIQNSDLRELQKNRLLRRLDRPWVANRVTDEITSRAMSAGLVAVEYDIVSGQAVTNVDWEGLIGFIERLLPLIVQLIGLFG